MHTVNSDLHRAVKFLSDLPVKALTLTSIKPDVENGAKTRTFQKSSKGMADATAWLRRQQADGRNVYYQDCDVRTLHKRPTKKDVTRILGAHIDIDCHVSPDQIEFAKQAVYSKLDAYSPSPSEIIDTGGGVQALWLLAEPLDGTPANIAHIEAVNRALVREFGGDRKCYDVAHLLRIPCTINFPDKKKRKAGRVPVAARVLRSDGVIFGPNIGDLPCDEIKAEHSEADVDFHIDVPNSVDLSALDPLVRELVEKGPPKGSKIGDGSRSDYTYYVAAQLRRCGFSDGQIVFVLTNPAYKASEHVLDQKQREPIETVKRIIRDLDKRAIGSAEADFATDPYEPTPEEMKESERARKKNERKAERAKEQAEKQRRIDHAPWNEQCVLIVQPPAFVRVDDKAILSFKSFDVAYGGVFQNHAAHAIALMSRRIKRYKGICYRPGQAAEQPDGLYNTWRGSGLVPLDEEPALFLDHINYLIPDEQSRGYVLDTLAWYVQRPMCKMMFAPLFVGPKGTGKSWLADLMVVILGSHNVSQPKRRRIVSDFNGWLGQKQLIVIHELKEKGAAGLADELKEYITQKTVILNLKNIEAFEIENFANFMTISNHEDAIPMDDDERRYMVVRCADGPRHGTNTPASLAYYDTLFASLTEDEPRRVLSWLMKRTIKLAGEGHAPRTEAREEMIELSRTGLEKVLHDAMQADEPPMLTPLINTGDVLDDLQTTGRLSHIPAFERNHKSVEQAFRKLGCKPLTKHGQISTGSGRRRLWVRDGARFAEFARKSKMELAHVYDQGRSQAAKFRAHEHAEFEQAEVVDPISV